ncbi:MAG TPA: AbrB/MazE/SpoVT family DNA-binding domain-containing protein [Terracidiphilus sp.]|nr:AbrB/MazE/SpoVT family DNA-binding domain-containing protein [Terracidiphilus sp.]
MVYTTGIYRQDGTNTPTRSNPKQTQTAESGVKTAKLFRNGRSQAVRLPKEFRFEGTEVAIRRDHSTGDIILSQANQQQAAEKKSLDELLKMIDEAQFPDDFMSDIDRRPPRELDLF